MVWRMGKNKLFCSELFVKSCNGIKPKEDKMGEIGAFFLQIGSKLCLPPK